MDKNEMARILLAQEPGQGNRHAEAAATPNIAGENGARHMRVDRRETADDYALELFRSNRYRVAECRDGLQWLLQRKRPRKSPGGAAWDTLAYCVTRKALARPHRSHSGADALEIAALARALQAEGRAVREMQIASRLSCVTVRVQVVKVLPAVNGEGAQ